MDRYAPKINTKPANKRPAKILALFGLVFLVMEILLVVPGMWLGIMMVRTWVYVLTIGISLTLFISALTVLAFQKKEQQRIMRVVGVTLIFVAFTVAYAVGSLVYVYATDNIGQGIYDSPNGEHSLYVCRVPEYDESGNETGAVYRGFRCFGKSVYIYEENAVPDAGSFEVSWPEANTAVLSSGEESATIAFAASGE